MKRPESYDKISLGVTKMVDGWPSSEGMCFTLRFGMRKRASAGRSAPLRLHRPCLSGRAGKEGDAYVDVGRTYCSNQPVCWLL